MIALCANNILLGLVIASIPALFGIFTFFIFNREKLSLLLLMVSSFLLRFAMIPVDPFLHSWDERFHALVAKNMISNPFKPMLRLFPILDYDPSAWCCNHV